jgi:hypothetical protein
MKLKSGFILKEIAGECVVVPVNSDLNLDGMLTLNSTAKTLWQALESGVDGMDELVRDLTDEYDVDEDLARAAAEKFVARLAELDLLA